MNRLEKAAAFGAMMGKRAVALNPMVLSSLAGAALGGGGTAIYDWLKGTKENKLRRAMIGAGVGGLTGAGLGHLAGKLAPASKPAGGKTTSDDSSSDIVWPTEAHIKVPDGEGYKTIGKVTYKDSEKEREDISERDKRQTAEAQNRINIKKQQEEANLRSEVAKKDQANYEESERKSLEHKKEMAQLKAHKQVVGDLAVGLLGGTTAALPGAYLVGRNEANYLRNPSKVKPYSNRKAYAIMGIPAALGTYFGYTNAPKVE